MQVGPVVGLSVFGAVANKKNVKFGSYNPNAARKIEQEIARNGIKCNMKGNDFLAECCNKTINVFQKLFKHSYLPSKLSYTEMSKSTYATFDKYSNEVSLNRSHDYGCFYNMENLKKEAKKLYNPILPGWTSSNHPAHIFVHEFSHAAHWNHLKERHGKSNAIKVMEGLHYTPVPTAIGRLITKFKLSKYAANGNMKEFLAERMTKDICDGLTDEYWVTYKNIDVDYSNIFSKKWNYRYSSPQSYIDYFTQQVWDGDIDGAKRVGEDATQYLKKLEATNAPIAVIITEKATEGVPLLGKITRAIGGAFERFTERADKRNKLKVGRY